MSGYFELADDGLLSLAQNVIDTYHPYLKQAGARFGFVFRSEPQKRKGSKVLAAVSVVSSQVKMHLDLDYLIWVSRDDWDDMSEKQRIALLDHEFCHCCMNEKFEWSTRDHDIQEFSIIIDRHGFWNDGLLRVAEVVQGHLPLIHDEKHESSVVAAPVAAMEVSA